jgi:hypothetical protein
LGIIKGMEQLMMTAHTGQGHETSTDLSKTELLSTTSASTTSSASGPDEEWQQPPLLPSVGRPVRRLRPNERQREVGLAAIAQARAALADAARRQASSHPHAA